MRADRRGFTVAELLIVVAIIGVLVGVAIPVFNNQAERAREATDAANIRSAYAEVRTACITDDRTSEAGWDASAGHWEKKVPLKQTVNKWDSQQFETALDGLCTSGEQVGFPYVKGYASVRCDKKGNVSISYTGSYINPVSAVSFLDKNLLMSILNKDANGKPINYPHSVVDSEEYHEGFGTERFNAAMKDAGFSLEDHGAASWTIYVKGSDGQYLDNPVIYYTPDKISQESSKAGDRIPVIGYRDGRYDVYIATIKEYSGDGKPYKGLSRLSPSAVMMGGSASFQYDTWEEAQAAYDCVKKAVDNGSRKDADTILKENNFAV